MGQCIGGNKSQRYPCSPAVDVKPQKSSVALYEGYLAAVWQNFVPVRGGCCVEKSEQSNAAPQSAVFACSGGPG